MAGTTKTSIQIEQYSNFCKHTLLDTSFGQVTNNFITRSQREVQDKYGLHCAKIFALLFYKIQRGGITLKGVPYKTSWRLDKDAALIFQKVNESLEGKNPTGQEVLKILIDKGLQVKERVKIWNDNFEGDQADIYSGEELKKAKIRKKEMCNRAFFSEQKQIRESLR